MKTTAVLLTQVAIEKKEKATVACAASTGIPVMSRVWLHWLAKRQKHTNHRKANTPRKHTGTQMHKHNTVIEVLSLHNSIPLLWKTYKWPKTTEEGLSRCRLLRHKLLHRLPLSSKNSWLWIVSRTADEWLIRSKLVTSSCSSHWMNCIKCGKQPLVCPTLQPYSHTTYFECTRVRIHEVMRWRDKLSV